MADRMIVLYKSPQAELRLGEPRLVLATSLEGFEAITPRPAYVKILVRGETYYGPLPLTVGPGSPDTMTDTTVVCQNIYA